MTGSLLDIARGDGIRLCVKTMRKLIHFYIFDDKKKQNKKCNVVLKRSDMSAVFKHFLRKPAREEIFILDSRPGNLPKLTRWKKEAVAPPDLYRIGHYKARNNL